ncbi:protein of unknown function [Candidatus Filomicrobium marinum]|uniref:Uncharacterized protein n=1 Tax=Candidatus Filomicrobium marinum TaxID=1608628 RepID=A0A0D6JFP1_9HYPH|nr:protein of unknown function [Candidatus Filomicrobium marinum]CPR18780.1 protein of unknown function [Candidatus Filomicrobium marinum]
MYGSASASQFSVDQDQRELLAAVTTLTLSWELPGRTEQLLLNSKCNAPVRREAYDSEIVERRRPIQD